MGEALVVIRLQQDGPGVSFIVHTKAEQTAFTFMQKPPSEAGVFALSAIMSVNLFLCGGVARVTGCFFLSFQQEQGNNPSRNRQFLSDHRSFFIFHPAPSFEQ